MGLIEYRSTPVTTPLCMHTRYWLSAAMLRCRKGHALRLRLHGFVFISVSKATSLKRFCLLLSTRFSPHGPGLCAF